MKTKLVIGMDFGTDSVRGILVNPYSGEILSKAVSGFKRWQQGRYCDPEKDQYRQSPLDYIESIDEIFAGLFEGLDPTLINQVVAIGTNTTGSTPVAIDENCRPLALLEEFKDNPNAMFILWKDHTAIQESDEINALARKWSIDYTRYCGGIYSSEWFWSKILHTNRRDKRVLEKAYSWMEQSDWIPTYLTGIHNPTDVKRNRCAAGHKAMWAEEHGGLPSPEFLCSLDPSFYHLVNRFYTDTYTSDEIFGRIAPFFVEKYGFHPDTAVTVGAIDAHHGAVGAGSAPYTLVKVVGTSTCDMLVVPKADAPPLVEGICGQVDGSIEPGMIGFEAGQSAFGDVYNWFRKLLINPVRAVLDDQLSVEQQQALDEGLFNYLTKEASVLPVTKDDLVFTDYHNGRRTPDADFTKEAAAYGFSLATHAGHIFKALVEATAFGSKAIVDRFQAFDIPIKSIIATGGIPNKSPYVVQVLADVLGYDVQVVDSDQTCALGSAIFASLASGIYDDIQEAKKVMAAKVVRTYSPNLVTQKAYEDLYHRYMTLTTL